MKQASSNYRNLPLVIVNHTYNDYLGGRAGLPTRREAEAFIGECGL